MSTVATERADGSLTMRKLDHVGQRRPEMEKRLSVAAIEIVTEAADGPTMTRPCGLPRRCCSPPRSR